MNRENGIQPPASAINAAQVPGDRLAMGKASSGVGGPGRLHQHARPSLRDIVAPRHDHDSAMPLAGQVVLVTGAARRIGAAVARAFHGAGARSPCIVAARESEGGRARRRH